MHCPQKNHMQGAAVFAVFYIISFYFHFHGLVNISIPSPGEDKPLGIKRAGDCCSYTCRFKKNVHLLTFQDLAVYEKEPESVVKNTEKGKVPYQSVPCLLFVK